MGPAATGVAAGLPFSDGDPGSTLWQRRFAPYLRGDVPSVNRTIGLGFETELTGEQLAAIAATYAAAGIPRWLVDWSPHAMPRAADSLFARHGGRAMTPTVKLWRPMRGDLPTVGETELRVVEIGADAAATFEATGDIGMCVGER